MDFIKSVFYIDKDTTEATPYITKEIKQIVMKNRIDRVVGLILLTGLMFSSCTNEELIDTALSYDNAISFDLNIEEQNKNNFSDKNSKAVEITDASLSDFGVFAYYAPTGVFNANSSTPNYMNNQHVTKNGDLWTYAPIKYWPAAGSISFFAYAPYNMAISTATTGTPVLTYTVPETIPDQIDLLVADPIANRVNDKQSIALNFKHALSCITFNAQTVETLPTGHTIKIKEVSITNLKNTATQTYSDPTDLTKWNWVTTTSTPTTNYLLSIENKMFEDKALTAKSEPISSWNGLLMPIPQTLGDDIEIKITADYFQDGAANSTPITATRKLNTIIPSLDKAQKYTINLSISGIVVEANITCTVADWTMQTITVPPFN